MYISPHAVPFELNEYDSSKFESFANIDKGDFNTLHQGHCVFHREGVEKER